MQHYGWPIVDLDKPWDAEELRPLMLHTWSNAPYREYDVPLRPFLFFRCPNGPDETHSDGQPFASYVGMGGIGEDAPMLPFGHERTGAWAYDRQTSVADLLDGAEHTILLIETAHENGCWIAGGKATVRGAVGESTSSLPYVRGVGDAGQFGGLHPGGGMTVFVDGHVDFVSDAMEPTVFHSLCTGRGEDAVVNAQQ
jgi:prepilin-type processing-associated H-X9-DG protein